MLGPYCCCNTPDCPGFCADTTNVNILVDLSGWGSGSSVPNPPDVGTCDTCSSLNQTYTLTYVTDPTGVPFSGCSTTDEDTNVPACFYRYVGSCGSEIVDNKQFARLIWVTLRVYVTNGGDRRGYLQVDYTALVADFLLGTSAGRIQIIADDFLIESGATETNCLDFTTSGTFSTCSSTVTATYDCTPPTGYSISVVAA